jgi:hypothetical protein
MDVSRAKGFVHLMVATDFGVTISWYFWPPLELSIEPHTALIVA